MEYLIGAICLLMLLGQIFFIFPLLKIFKIAEKLETTNLLLTVMANKMGATDNDVKEAHSKANGIL